MNLGKIRYIHYHLLIYFDYGILIFLIFEAIAQGLMSRSSLIWEEQKRIAPERIYADTYIMKALFYIIDENVQHIVAIKGMPNHR